MADDCASSDSEGNTTNTDDEVRASSFSPSHTAREPSALSKTDSTASTNGSYSDHGDADQRGLSSPALVAETPKRSGLGQPAISSIAAPSYASRSSSLTSERVGTLLGKRRRRLDAKVEQEQVEVAGIGAKRAGAALINPGQHLRLVHCGRPSTRQLRLDRRRRRH